MTTAEQQTYDFLGAISDAPEDLLWLGVYYEGTRGGFVRTEMNMEGGLLAEPIVVWSTTLKKYDQKGALIDRFPNFASAGDLLDALDGETVSIDGRSLRVEKVAIDEFEVALQLDLASPHKEGK